jgi:hypothetical protein
MSFIPAEVELVIKNLVAQLEEAFSILEFDADTDAEGDTATDPPAPSTAYAFERAKIDAAEEAGFPITVTIHTKKVAP